MHRRGAGLTKVNRAVSDRDDVLMQLISATGMEVEDALRSLERHNWDLAACVDALFAGAASSTTTALPPPPQRRPASYDDDDDGVRAPIMPRAEVLVGDPVSAGLAGLAQRSRPLSAAHYNTNAFDPSTAAQRDFRAEGRFGGAVRPTAAPQTSKKLAELFRAPTELLFIGSYDEAVVRAVAERKWLVVNVQELTDFDSQRLNRDTWKHPGVAAILTASCIFMQLPVSHPDARRFATLYPSNRAVHIAVIDARTGERALSWDGFVDALEFAQRITDLIDSHPLDRFVNRRPSTTATADFTRAASRAVDTADDDEDGDVTEVLWPRPDDGKVKRPLTEDEELEAAIAASIESAAAAAAVPTTTTGKRKAASDPAPTPTASQSQPSFQQLDDVVLPPAKKVASAATAVAVPSAPAMPRQSESEADACECVIMLRLLDGGRLKCGFASSATLADLHRYAAQHGFAGGGEAVPDFALTLQFPTRVFSGEQLASVTFKEANLVGRNQVMVTALSTAAATTNEQT